MSFVVVVRYLQTLLLKKMVFGSSSLSDFLFLMAFFPPAASGPLDSLSVLLGRDSACGLETLGLLI